MKSDNDDSDIVSLSPINRRLGSCPECGKPIWENDYHHMGRFGPLYRCFQCKVIFLKETVIPF